MKSTSLIAASLFAATMALAAPAAAQEAEPFIGASVGYHDLGLGFAEDDEIIYGAVAGVDVPVNEGFFVGAEVNYHLGGGAIDNEYGIAARAGISTSGGSKFYVKGGYQEVDLDIVTILGGNPPPTLDDSAGDYIFGVGADIKLGSSQVRLRLSGDTIAFDTTRLTAGVLFAF